MTFYTIYEELNHEYELRPNIYDGYDVPDTFGEFIVDNWQEKANEITWLYSSVEKRKEKYIEWLDEQFKYFNSYESIDLDMLDEDDEYYPIYKQIVQDGLKKSVSKVQLIGHDHCSSKTHNVYYTHINTSGKKHRCVSTYSAFKLDHIEKDNIHIFTYVVNRLGDDDYRPVVKSTIYHNIIKFTMDEDTYNRNMFKIDEIAIKLYFSSVDCYEDVTIED